MSDNSGLIASALYKSNPALAEEMDWNNSFKAYIKGMGAKVDLYRDYERGEHRAVITNQMRKLLRLEADDSGITDFNGNYCGIVIDKMAGRLQVSEVTTKDATVDDEWLTPLLEKNDWENLQSSTFRGAVRDADSYIMIDPETLSWTAEPAYDGYSGIVGIFESGSRTPMWACKIWAESSTQKEDSATIAEMKLVVYEPGVVSYWKGNEGAGEVEPDEVQDDMVAVDTSNDVTLRGANFKKFPVSKVPIVHFANRYENYSEMGESEIRAAIPLQDVYNRTLHTLTYASENAGYTKPWIKGMEMNTDGLVPGAVINLLLTDAQGNTIVEPTPEMLAFLQAVQVGQIEPTDTNQFILIEDWVVRQISFVTQTPIYGVTTDGNLSGEALKQLEIGLIGKIVRFQQQNADSIRELIQLTAEVQNAFRIEGLGSAPTIESVNVIWKSPEILDVTSQIQALAQMRTSAPGLWSDDWYRSKIGGLLGMSQSDIMKQTEEVKTQRRQAVQDRINSIRVPATTAPADMMNGTGNNAA